MKESIFNYFDSISINDYIAHIYNNNSERFEIASRFISDGLKQGQKCIFVNDTKIPEELIARLKILDIQVDKCLKNKSISEIKLINNNIDGTTFNDPIKSIEKELRRLSKKNKGLKFRILSSYITSLPNINNNYQLYLHSSLNILAKENPVIFLNQFELSRMNSRSLLNILKTHQIIIEDNFVYKNSFHNNPKEIISKLDKEKSKLDSLSTQEIKVLSFIVSGLSNRNIATELSISIRTVESHRYNLMKKLNLKNTVDLIKFALKNGIN